MDNKLVEIKDLTKVFRIGGLFLGTKLVAVDHVNLSLPSDRPSILSVVGESGSGKTTLARMMLRLLEPTEGDVYIGGRHLFTGNRMSNQEFRRYVQPIFQNPFESFSLRKSVDTYLYETAINLGIARNRRSAQEVIATELASVGLNIDTVVGKYPNQFSGGELQRISVARALIPRPKLIIADEPVSMIDASLRMHVVNLFLELKESHNVSFFYITHDLSTAYYVSDYIAIMYRGNVVEYGPSDQILTSPEHPYTELLMESVPKIGERWSEEISLPDVEIKEYGITACKFANRCQYVQQVCREHRPPMVEIGEERRSFCFRPVDYELNRTVAEPKPVAEAQVPKKQV
jgi:peptide/nickel transport system ATP-binding protein